MRRLRVLAWALVPALLGVPGCDVAVGIYFATKKSDKKDSAPPPVDARFFIWMANLATPADGDAQLLALQGNGNPNPAVWTQVGSGTATTEITSGLPAGMNSVLIQVTANQQYEVDALEILDANGTVIDWAGTAWADGVTTAASSFLKTPDGATVNTNATSAQNAVVFGRTSTASITGFRVSLWAPNFRTSGDVVWATTASRPGNEVAGGMAVSVAGDVVASFGDTSSKNTFFYKLDSNGVLQTQTAVETITSVTGGAPSVAIDSGANLIYVGSLLSPIASSEENLEVRTFSLPTPGAPSSFFTQSALLGKERIEAHGLTLDPNKNLIVAGGAPRLTEGVNHWIRKVDVLGTQQWELLEGPGSDTGDSYWYAVTTDSVGNIYVAGYINNGANLEDIRIARLTSAGVFSPAAPITEGTTSNDRGTSVAVDGTKLYVGGYLTKSGQKNGVVFKYDAATLTPDPAGFPIEHNGPAGADDEILDVVAESGFLWVVGYETVSSPSQGKNMWIRKYDSAGTVLWTRTHHEAGGATGDDRAVSVRIDGAFLVVSGEVTLGGGGVDIHVRKYVK